MKNKTLALDTNIFIYHFEDHPVYAPVTSRIFSKLFTSSYKGLTSIISFIEALSYPGSKIVREKLKEEFKAIPHFTLYDVTYEVGEKAAQIRREYGFRLPDSIQLATAFCYKADIFITNDKRLKSFQELQVQLLSERKFSI